MYRGRKYLDRAQAQIMREASQRAYRAHRRALALEQARPKQTLQPVDMKRHVYLPPAGSIAFSLLYQVAR